MHKSTMMPQAVDNFTRRYRFKNIRKYQAATFVLLDYGERQLHRWDDIIEWVYNHTYLIFKSIVELMQACPRCQVSIEVESYNQGTSIIRSISWATRINQNDVITRADCYSTVTGHVSTTSDERSHFIRQCEMSHKNHLSFTIEIKAAENSLSKMKGDAHKFIYGMSSKWLGCVCECG